MFYSMYIRQSCVYTIVCWFHVFLQCVVDCICTGCSCESLVLSVMSVHFVDSCHV